MPGAPLLLPADQHATVGDWASEDDLRLHQIVSVTATPMTRSVCIDEFSDPICSASKNIVTGEPGGRRVASSGSVFNKRDLEAPTHFWSDTFSQHSADRRVSNNRLL
jgi:hypothetical protein